MKIKDLDSVPFFHIVPISLLTLFLSVTGCTKKTSDESTALVDAAHVMDGAWKFDQCNSTSNVMTDGNTYLSYHPFVLIDGDDHYHAHLYFQSEDCTGSPALSINGVDIIDTQDALKATTSPSHRQILSPAGAPDDFYVMVDYWVNDQAETTYGKAWFISVVGDQSTFYYGYGLPCIGQNACSISDDWTTLVATAQSPDDFDSFLNDPFGFSGLNTATRFTETLVPAPTPSASPSPSP